MSAPVIHEYAKSTNKAGKEVWYRHCKRQMRYFRVSSDSAKLAIATGRGYEIEYFPYSRPDLWLAAMEKRKQLAKMPVFGMVQ